VRPDVHREDGCAFYEEDRAQVGLNGDGVNRFA
jgi:hypothetical protein